MLRPGPLAPWWSPEVEAAVLPIFEEGDDGLARARLPFDAAHGDRRRPARQRPGGAAAAGALPGVAGGGRAGLGDGARGPVEAAALERAAALLARPRVQRWAGAVHDVPLQWPALVAGLVRAAVEEVARDPAPPARGRRPAARRGASSRPSRAGTTPATPRPARSSTWRRSGRPAPVAAVDPDDYYDFQVNRPVVQLVDGAARRITWPTTRFSVCRPGGRQPRRRAGARARAQHALARLLRGAARHHRGARRRAPS